MPRNLDFLEGDDDGGEGWLEQPNIKIPELHDLQKKINKEYTNNPVDRETVGKRPLDTYIECCVFEPLAQAFGMTLEPLIDSWRKNEKAVITAHVPDTKLCSSQECRQHQPAAVYIPSERAIHAPRALPDKIFKWLIVGIIKEQGEIHMFAQGNEAIARYIAFEHVRKAGELVVLREQVGRAFHHQLNEEVYRAKQAGTVEDMDASTLVGCVGRLAQFIHTPWGTPEHELKSVDKSNAWMRRYFRNIDRTTPQEVLRKARRAKDKELLRYGFGYALAKEISHVSDISRLGGYCFGSVEDCGMSSVLRLLLPARDLEHAAELLFQKSEGAADCHPELWQHRKVFYAAMAHKCYGLRQYLYNRKQADFTV